VYNINLKINCGLSCSFVYTDGVLPNIIKINVVCTEYLVFQIYILMINENFNSRRNAFYRVLFYFIWFKIKLLNSYLFLTMK
jgi:hypothetical protein